MPSKMITDRQKAAAHLSGTVETYAAQAADVFIQLIEPDLDEGALAPDMVHLQTLLRRRLDRLRKKLIELDEAHSAERNEDRSLREKRDTAARELKDLFLRLRGVLDNACGSDSCSRLLGVDGRIPRDPVVLLRVAKRLAEGLRGDLLEGTESLLSDLQLNTTAWVELLQGPMERLEAALNGLSRERPETAKGLVAKTSLIAEYDRTYRATATIVESLFRYVGRPDLAERIRPKQRSPSGDSIAGETGKEVDEAPSEDGVEIFPVDPDDGFGPV